ncbi:MAG: DUF3263 domain-containing protein [Actinomycetota bacterium]
MSIPARRRAIAPLDPAVRAVLDVEREWAASPSLPKERLIRERLGLTPARYQLALQRALDDPAALAAEPLLVRRLLRLRERRRRRLGPARGLE